VPLHLAAQEAQEAKEGREDGVPMAVAGKGGQVITVAVATTGAAAVERSPWREVDIEYMSRSG